MPLRSFAHCRLEHDFIVSEPITYRKRLATLVDSGAIQLGDLADVHGAGRTFGSRCHGYLGKGPCCLALRRTHWTDENSPGRAYVHVTGLLGVVAAEGFEPS